MNKDKSSLEVVSVELPRRYERQVQECLGEYAGSLGVHCGVVILEKSQAVTNPTTEEIIGVAMSTTLSVDGIGGVTSTRSNLERLSAYIEEYRKPFRVRVARKIGKFVATRGGSVRDDKLDELLETTRKTLQEQEADGFTLECNLLAPDFSVGDAEAIGALSNIQSRNLYFVGDATVDQDERSGGFWAAVDSIANKNDFNEYTGYHKSGLGELLTQVIKDADGSPYLTDDEKLQIGDFVLDVAKRRCEVVDRMQKLQNEYLDLQHQCQQKLDEHQRRLAEQESIRAARERYGVKMSNDMESVGATVTDGLEYMSNSEVANQIKNIDQSLINAVAKLLVNARKIRMKAYERYVKSTLIDIYATDTDTISSFQDFMLSELSRAITRQPCIDPYSEQLREPLSFIMDIPEMVEGDPTDQGVVNLYEAFYNNYYNDELPLKDPKKFIRDLKKTRENSLKS